MSKQWLIAILSIFVCVIGSTAFADPLRYEFKDNQKPIYAVTIRSELPSAVITDSGRISYDVKSVDPTNGQITLSYSAQMQISSESKLPQNRPQWPQPPSIPRPPNPFAAPPAGPEIMIDAQGNVIRSNRTGEDQQLTGSLGLNWQLLLQPLGADNEQTWKKETALTLFATSKQQNRMQPGPWQQQPEERVERPAHQTLTYSIISTDGDLVKIKRQIELATDEKVGDSPVERITGEGEIVFDSKAGMVRSLELKQTIEVNQENVSVKVPTTVSAHLLTPEELAKIKADQEAAIAKAHVVAAEQQTKAAADARKQLPTTQRSDLQIKGIEAGWTHSTVAPEDVLAKMQGDCTRDPDGTVLLGSGQHIATPDSYEVPTTIRAIVLTHDNDIRLGYAADQVIFNWEMQATELRVDGGPASGKYKPGAGKLMANRWVGIEWVIHPDEMI
ncbi:MAG: hypothetical protein JO353_00620, partial [Phycisphaerae bacterium]|nr:hypothetical protein [Phycisphaerae bacterium]